MSLDKTMLNALEQKSKAPRYGAQTESPFELLGSLIGKLQKRVDQLEQRSFSYQGTWKDGKVYSPGQFVTYSGGLWHSNVFHNKQRPGDGDAAWQLAVKAGRDGKDAKGAA
jgi:hypothetical protein